MRTSGHMKRHQRTVGIFDEKCFGDTMTKSGEKGSHVFTFRYQADREMVRRGYITVDKGSVTVNGVSFEKRPFFWDRQSLCCLSQNCCINIFFQFLVKMMMA